MRSPAISNTSRTGIVGAVDTELDVDHDAFAVDVQGSRDSVRGRRKLNAPSA